MRVLQDEEAAVIAEFKKRRSGLKVATRIVKDPKPVLFVRVTSNGGSLRDFVTARSLLTVEVFGKTEAAARGLCGEILGWVLDAAENNSLGGVVCYGVSVLGLPANMPLPSVDTHYRYQFSFSADLRFTQI